MKHTKNFVKIFRRYQCFEYGFIFCLKFHCHHVLCGSLHFLLFLKLSACEEVREIGKE